MLPVQIDLNDPLFSLEDVRQLIASKDDSEDRQLRVTADGIAYISDITGAEQREGLSFRLATWDAGNDHTGKNASLNAFWVSTIHNVLKNNWPTPSSSYIEVY